MPTILDPRTLRSSAPVPFLSHPTRNHIAFQHRRKGPGSYGRVSAIGLEHGSGLRCPGWEPRPCQSAGALFVAMFGFAGAAVVSAVPMFAAAVLVRGSSTNLERPDSTMR